MYRLIETGKQFVREDDTFGTRDMAIESAMKRSVREEYVYHSWTAVPDKRLVAHEVIVLDDADKTTNNRVGVALGGKWTWLQQVKQPYG